MKSLNDFRKTNKELNKSEMLSLKGGCDNCHNYQETTYYYDDSSGRSGCDYTYINRQNGERVWRMAACTKGDLAM